MTAPGIPNEYTLSTSCFGTRLKTIEDQAFASVAMGFRRLELGLADAPVTMNGFEETRRETGVTLSSVVAGCLKPQSLRMASTLLGSIDDDEREQAILSVRRHIQMAQRLECPVVVLRGCAVADDAIAQEAQLLTVEIDEEQDSEELREKAVQFSQKLQQKGQAQVEHLCRSLHRLLQEYPETRLALEPGQHVNDLLSFDVMGWVLEDLSRYGVGYWHDVGWIHMRERVGLPGQGEWLDTYAPKMLGVHVQDAAENQTAMPPGLGEVDFKLICEYVPSDATRVVDVDPRHGRAELLASVQFLADMGF